MERQRGRREVPGRLPRGSRSWASCSWLCDMFLIVDRLLRWEVRDESSFGVVCYGFEMWYGMEC
ncbi:uncharacterized protein BDV14DRAFT_176136 [Aspergillus stella-maris]|uniref:uncharacterized protein n=1 Tax=Aspergillus stella-maris TaxID=1810926 RepID=UPI003CCD6701